MSTKRKKLVPLWTAHLSAEDVQPFVAHLATTATKPQTRFALSLGRRNKPFSPKEVHLPIEVKRLTSMETRLDDAAIAAAREVHDAMQRGPRITEKMMAGFPKPARSARTAEAKNRARE